MKKNILLSLIILLINIVSTQSINAQQQDSHIAQVLKNIASSEDFKTAGFGFLAIDINTGETIAELNPDMSLKPASTLKLLTTATALELLGSDFQFKTTLEYSGKIENHILQGDIFIKGGGDPSLGSKYFDSTKDKQFFSSWIKAVRDLGIDSINGSIIADARAFSWDITPPTWSWLNMGNYYGAGPCGLSIFDNYYRIYFNTGTKLDNTVNIIKTTPPIPGLVFDNTVTAANIKYDNAYIFGAPYSNTRYIRGQLPINRKSFSIKGSIPDPAYIAAYQFDSLLNLNNISTSKKPNTVRLLLHNGEKLPDEKTSFFTTQSPKISEIIEQTNMHSINLFAEHCLIQAGIQLGAKAETVASVDSLISFWESKGMDSKGMFLYDGSGLSLYNAISARQMVFLLKYMKTESEYFDVFYQSLPIAGKTGTIKHRFKNTNAQGNLRAKTGTLDHVRTYSGYVTSKSNREIAFAILLNNYSCKSSEAKAHLEKLMLELANLTY
jgi:D-alanyl-D-alanine carboxypeptidase/D-alanyl-D-alanine-endopeptidase (penicillin-binding protein 4)